MSTFLSTVRDVGVKLGGLERVAGRYDTDTRHCLDWLRRGWFPRYLEPQIRYDLAVLDCVPADNLFGPQPVVTPFGAEKNISAATIAMPRNAFSSSDAPQTR